MTAILCRDLRKQYRSRRATVEAVRMGKKMMFASSAKGERDLGFKILPVYPALRAAIEPPGASYTTFPCASVTVPRIRPSFNCAEAGIANPKTTTRTNADTQSAR